MMPEWYLNYQVAALGAYSTIFIEALFLILGRPFENASPLSISILTNGSAVLLAGLGGACATSLAALRIGLTTVFLFFSIVLVTEAETFDGTYAILCSIAHLSYHWFLRRDQRKTGRFDGGLLFSEGNKEFDNRDPRDRGLGDKECWNAERFQRALTFELGDRFHVDGDVLLFTVLGTALTYRVFDFDLGFGLFFASVSGFWSLVLLILINSVRLRGRRVELHGAIQCRFLCILILTLPENYLFFALNYSDVQWADEITWWKPAVGIAWLFSFVGTIYTPLRFFLHATLFPCAACLQKRDTFDMPINDNISRCPWGNCVSLPAAAGGKNKSDSRTIFQIKHQKGPDNIDRFWLNGSQFCQQCPLHTVIAFVACLLLFVVSFNLSEIERHCGVFPVLSNICVVGTFYVAMTFAFAATGHATIQDSQELVVLRGDDRLRPWYTLSKALLATSFVHVATVVGAATWRGISSDKEVLVLVKRLSSLVMPTACVSMMPLLLAGISTPSIALDHEESPLFDNSATVQLPTGKAAQPETKLWNINSALIYSSSRVKRLDLRMLLMGTCVTVFDAIYAVWHHEHALLAPSLPITSIVFAFTTGNVLYFMNFIPSSRRIEPGILAAAAVAVVGVCSHQNLWNLFAVYGDEFGEHDDHNGSRLPVKIAIWYNLLLSVLMVDGDRVHCKAYEGPPPTTRQRQTYYLLNTPFRIRKVGFMWQLRHGTLVLVLGLAYISSLYGDDWPLPVGTTALNLLVFVVIMSVHFRSPKLEDQYNPSRGHQIALVISIVATVTAVVFSRDHIITYASDWATGACTAFFSYLVLSAAIRFSPHVTERYKGTK